MKSKIIFMVGVVLSIVIFSVILFNLNTDKLVVNDIDSLEKIIIYNNEEIYKIITDDSVISEVKKITSEIVLDSNSNVESINNEYYVELIDVDGASLLEFSINPGIDIINNDMNASLSASNYDNLINVLGIGDKNITDAIFIRTTTDNLIYTSNGEIVVVSDSTGKGNIFDECSTGDKVEIELSQHILSSDPAQTGAYRCDVLENGTIDNLDEGIRFMITEYGYEVIGE